MKSNWRSGVALVLLFTAAAVTMLWGLNQRSQKELRAEVIERAGLRSAQLADAMAGQVAAELALMDHMLLDVRENLLEKPTFDPVFIQEKLTSLPDGLMTHLSVVNEEGVVVYTSRGLDLGLDIKERSHFKDLKADGDRLVIGPPVFGKSFEWIIPVGRPLLRNGEFEGATYLLISTERLAERLGRLSLAKEDLVTLIHPNGQILALSVNNAAAMGQSAPANLPFLQDGSAMSGSFRDTSDVDGLDRVFGWHRLQDSGVLVVVGLAESSVLAPLATSINRSFWLTGVLSAVLLVGGLAVAWLLWRNGLSAQAMRESEQHLNEAQRVAKVGHMSTDMRAGVTVWSDETFRIFGYERDDPALDISNFEAVFARVHPEDLPALKADFGASIRGCYSIEITHRIVMPDGQVKYLRVQSVVEGENGIPVRGSATVQDITEVKLAQLA